MEEGLTHFNNFW